jgi:hypothetical protein
VTDEEIQALRDQFHQARREQGWGERRVIRSTAVPGGMPVHDGEV